MGHENVPVPHDFQGLLASKPRFRFGLSHTPDRDHSFLTFTSEDTKDVKNDFDIKACVFS